MSSTSASLSRMGARRFQSRALLALIYAVLLVSIIYPMVMILYESIFRPKAFSSMRGVS